MGLDILTCGLMPIDTLYTKACSINDRWSSDR